MTAAISPNLLRISHRVLSGFIPPPDLKPSEYAEEHIHISNENAIPGLIRFDNAPYQREPLDMTANPDCRRITLMWGAQVGKTQLALCAQAYHIHQNPTSQIMMQPSQGDLQTWLETKFNPMLDANVQLQNTVAKPRGREGVNNQRMKSYPGGFLMFSWSGSPKTMRGRSAPFIVCDETDGYDRTAEGHPVNLLWQRAATFGDQRLLMEISTPTIKGASWIEKSYELGDQRRFHVPCPCCGHEQPLDWNRVKWDQGEDGEHIPATARYVCANPKCVREETGQPAQWTNAERVAAIKWGRWVAQKPFRGHASYHLSELYSCFVELGDIVQSFLDKKAADDLQTFVNVSLAQTWEETGDSVDSATLLGRVEKYRAEVPRGACILTAGVDMQDNRLEVEVVGWGPGEESWSIDYQVLYGDPLEPELWNELDEYLATTFQHESGAELPIAGVCLDTGGKGGMTQAAYEYAAGKLGRKLFAIKGISGWNRPVVSASKRQRPGRNARAVDLFQVGVDEAKLAVYRRLASSTPGAGYCHFPDSRDPEWFAQICAEFLVTKYVKGFPVREWHCKVGVRNEALDCRVYAYAALKLIRPNLKKLSIKLNANLPPPANDEPEKPARDKHQEQPIDTSFVPKALRRVYEYVALGGIEPQMLIDDFAPIGKRLLARLLEEGLVEQIGNKLVAINPLEKTPQEKKKPPRQTSISNRQSWVKRF